MAATETTPQVEFEYIPCPLCDHTEFSSVFSFADPHGAYTLVRCVQCSFCFLNPRPTRDTIGAYYSASEYQPFVSQASRFSLTASLYRRVRKYSVRWKRRLIARLHERGRILDLGCGTGEFLAEMKRSGWEAMGVEMSPEAAEYARNRLGLAVDRSAVDEPIRISEQFDVITLWHVLEHVHQPQQVFGNLHNLLKPDGLVVIAVPNVASPDAVTYGRHWIALDPPRHLLHFTPTTIRRMLKVHDWRLVEIRQIPLDTIFNALYSMVAAMRQDPPWLKPLRVVQFLFLLPMSLWKGRGGRNGSTMMCIAVPTKKA